MKLVIGHALKLAGIGLAIALPISFAVSRVMANVIFGVVTADFAVVAGLTLLLIVVAVVAAYFPARRALRIDPMIALRYE
jgi:ABC-type antimicrobial peptide transport system permease subunit